MTAIIKDGVITITMKLGTPKPSKSGKTNLLATTSGFIPVDGNDTVRYSVNVNQK